MYGYHNRDNIGAPFHDLCYIINKLNNIILDRIAHSFDFLISELNNNHSKHYAMVSKFGMTSRRLNINRKKDGMIAVVLDQSKNSSMNETVWSRSTVVSAVKGSRYSNPKAGISRGDRTVPRHPMRATFQR